MASAFAEFLESEKIDPRRLRAASRHLERLRPEDRVLRRLRASKKEPKEGEEPLKKPRSRRVITPRLIRSAQAGEKLSGPQKTRLLRAVNRIMEQRKKDPVDLRKLF